MRLFRDEFINYQLSIFNYFRGFFRHQSVKVLIFSYPKLALK